MSSGLSITIIVIIIAIIVAVTTAVVINKSNTNKLDKVERDSADLNDASIKEDIKRLDKMDLAGKSLATFNEWKKTYDSVETQDVATLHQLLERGVAENARYSLFKAKKTASEAQELSLRAHKNLKESKKVFTELLESNHDNQVQYASLLKEYQEMRKEVLAKSYNYEVALDKIEDKLTTMESKFDSVKNLSAQGDHVEAKRVLNQIDEELRLLKKQLPKIKELDNDLKNTFPEQLEEINDTYKKMVKEKYKIKEVNILDEVKNIYDQIDKNFTTLGEMNIDSANKNNEIIASQIDNLYSILTKEFKARPFVDKNQDKIVELLGHSAHNSSQLVTKLQHIDESYELTHGELQEAKTLESEVNHLNVEFGTDCQKIADGEGVYSEIQNKWLDLLKKLEEIDQREKQISQDVDGLFDAEAVANDSIEKFKQEVSLIYRKLERRSLPGKPESFVQMYTLVVNEITKTSNELKQVRINMEHISDELIQIQEDIERLKKEAEEILSSADLVELTMQYSNKFLNDPEIKKARKETYNLYQNEYEYQEALDTIATAIEKSEPGSFQRLEQEYYADKKERELAEQEDDE
ncbi:septation ring formation regulator [Lactobacillus colini]|uniref:Septation ring formation regulator EzrA n=1 Tax=Lactobacillus colini TaxID=1819254 RepID=A0ABS4MEQ6_9LACO|nr:septation ring formation regulator EzrA [Lactobacillus colini]MBP2057826.1 septation ring formation regulator [Lactobacillus colini]